MGYTHYFKINAPLEPVPFAQFVSEAALVADASRILLVSYTGDCGTLPEFSDGEIAFNGCGKYSHESFNIGVGWSGFNFCKTARKPYDEIVTGILILLAARFPQVDVSSDGTADEWADGLRLARTVNPAAQIPEGVTC